MTGRILDGATVGSNVELIWGFGIASGFFDKDGDGDGVTDAAPFVETPDVAGRLALPTPFGCVPTVTGAMMPSIRPFLSSAFRLPRHNRVDVSLSAHLLEVEVHRKC